VNFVFDYWWLLETQGYQSVAGEDAPPEHVAEFEIWFWLFGVIEVKTGFACE
jgi:hypothetical protein